MPELAALMIADGTSFVSRPVPTLSLTLGGIADDRHAGPTRPADARTPWHKRGTPIANTRQVSIVSVEDCAEVAAAMGVPAIDPSLLGANLVLSGLPRLSLLAPGARLQFPSGATVFVTEPNAPCRQPGAAIARAFAEPVLAARFVKAALGRRGVVGLVERAGDIAVGDPVRVIGSPAAVAAPRVAQGDVSATEQANGLA